MHTGMAPVRSTVDCVTGLHVPATILIATEERVFARTSQWVINMIEVASGGHWQELNMRPPSFKLSNTEICHLSVPALGVQLP